MYITGDFYNGIPKQGGLMNYMLGNVSGSTSDNPSTSGYFSSSSASGGAGSGASAAAGGGSGQGQSWSGNQQQNQQQVRTLSPQTLFSVP